MQNELSLVQNLLAIPSDTLTDNNLDPSGNSRLLLMLYKCERSYKCDFCGGSIRWFGMNCMV